MLLFVWESNMSNFDWVSALPVFTPLAGVIPCLHLLEKQMKWPQYTCMPKVATII